MFFKFSFHLPWHILILVVLSLVNLYRLHKAMDCNRICGKFVLMMMIESFKLWLLVWVFQMMYNALGGDFMYASVARALGPSVTTSSTDFSFQNLVFWNFWNFQRQKSLKIQYFPHSESKSYQITSIKSCSSRSFQQQHQRHIPIPPKFSATI